MAATGKAAVFHGPGKPFELTELPLPEVETRGVLIRASVANICGSDLHFWRGDAPLKLPDDGWIYGHEMCGRVARLGVEIKTDSLGEPLKEGDRVDRQLKGPLDDALSLCLDIPTVGVRTGPDPPAFGGCRRGCEGRGIQSDGGGPDFGRR